MSEDQADPKNGDEARRDAPLEKPEIPDLLPSGFRGEQTQRGERARQGAVDHARDERDIGRRKRQRVRRLERKENRNLRKKNETRVLFLEKVSIALILTVIFSAPFLIGAVHLVTVIPLMVLAILSMTTAFVICHQRGLPFRADIIGWTLLGLSALTFFQAMPLPIGVVETLSPGVAGWLVDAFGSATAPTTASLALYPGEAARAGFGLLAATAIYFSAFNLFQNKARFQKMLLALPVIGVLLVVIGVLQKVLGSSGLLFFYMPRDLTVMPFFSSTFVNPNHLATLLGLCSFVPLGLSLSQDYKMQRGLLLMLFAICSAGMVMTLSATAVLSWLIGLAAFAILTVRRRFSNRVTASWLSLSVLGAVALGAYAAWTQLADKLSFLAEHQGLLWFRPTYLWAEGLHIARQHPLFGLGPGGFSDAFAMGAHPALPGRYDYVSNTYLQLAVDHGLPLAILAIGAFAVAVLKLGLRGSWKREDLPVMTGLFAAFVFLGFEASIGFSLEIPGVLLPVVYLLALARGRNARYDDLDARGMLVRKRSSEDGEDESGAEAQRRRQGTSRRQTTLARRALPMASVLAIATISGLALPAAMDAATGGPNHELRKLAGEKGPLETFEEAVQASVERRPAYSPTHLTAAIGYRLRGQADLATAALERAELFDVGNPAPWLLQAQIEAGAGHLDKSHASYKKSLALACNTEGPGRDAIALEISRVFKEPRRVAAALPPEKQVWASLLASLLEAQRPGRVIDIAAAIEVEHRGHPDLNVTTIHAARAEAMLGRWPRARHLAETLLDEAGQGPAAAFTILAQAALHEGQHRKALKHTEVGLRQHPSDIELNFTTVDLLIEHRPTLGGREFNETWRQKMDTRLRVLRPFAIQRPELRFRFYRASALYAASRGVTPTAIRDIQRALEANGDDVKLLYLLFELLEKERRFEEAIEAAKAALKRAPDDPRAPAVTARLEKMTRQKAARDSYR